MTQRLHAVWHCLTLHSTEHCVVLRDPDGWTMRGAVTVPVDDDHADIRYMVNTDEAWVTKGVDVEITDTTGQQRISVVVKGGEWTVNGDRDDSLSGCVDVDLGWTPATNTLPIRRLSLDVGEKATTRSAWLRFPEFDLEPSDQTYERIGETRWRYTSGSADHLIETTADGIVTSYGDLWRGAVDPHRPYGSN